MAASTMTDLRALQGRLGRDDLIRAFRIMYLSRRIDDREIVLKRQRRFIFKSAARGMRPSRPPRAWPLRPGHDWFYPLLSRPRAGLALGVTPQEMFLQAVGSEDDRASGGRQMPSHWSSPRLHIVAPLLAHGHAFHAGRGLRQRRRGYLDAVIPTRSRWSATGEGATSEGEFWESLNVACLERLPVLYLVEDNGYAISVPVEKQTAGGNIARLVQSFPDLAVFECDGTNFIESYAHHGGSRGALPPRAWLRRWCTPPARGRIRIRFPTTRSMYKTKAERDAEAARDPLVRFPEWLRGGRHPGCARRLEMLTHEVDRGGPGGHRACAEGGSAGGPATRCGFCIRTASTRLRANSRRSRSSTGNPRTMVDAINLTLNEEMRRNPNMVVFGEDVADCSREENLGEVKGKGGVFKATQGLQTAFGSAARLQHARSPKPASWAGRPAWPRADLKPVVEIQFFDYIWPAMMQIRDELATLRWRS